MFDFLLSLGIILLFLSIVGVIKGNLKSIKFVKSRKAAVVLFIVSLVYTFTVVALVDENETAFTNNEQTHSSGDNSNNNGEEVANNDIDIADSKSNDEDSTEETTNNDNEQKEQDSGKLTPLKVHFIDVGQADAALIEYADAEKEYHILIDSGDWNSEKAVNYLAGLGVEDLDLVVGSHPHADHIGQIDNIIKRFNVDEVWMSGDVTTSQVFERVIDEIASNDVGYNEPRAGEEYEIGPLQIKIANPQSVNGDLNNGSIVMKLTYGSATFLFTGDAEKSAEAGMLNRKEDISADVLKVGHHGSDTSNTPGFLKEVNPKIAVISASENNSYGHPSPSVVSRFRDMGVDLYVTKDDGTVIVETDGVNYNVSTR